MSNIDRDQRQPAGTKDPDEAGRAVQEARAGAMGLASRAPQGKATAGQRAKLERRGKEH